MRENVSLKPFNTFGLEAGAKYFEEINNEDEVLNLLHQERFGAMPLLILGGGSNVLFTQDFDGLVLLNRLKGIKILNETDSEILLEVASGEVWHDFVLHAVKNGWSGIENLSLIPGTVGAAPMQNIGAYGVEVKNVIEQVRYLVLDTLQIETLNAAACEFGYRESVFKHDLKGKVFILSVQFRLSKGAFIPQISYGAIQETLAEKQITNPSIQEVSEAVIAIRQSKLPDPAVLGNSGSFFKNPEIPEAQFNELKKKFETLPSYPTTPGFVKIPAGWLIEHAGWKGKRVGETGSHAEQALVLVNYGNAEGYEVKALAFEIIADIQAKFGIRLSPEVNIF